MSSRPANDENVGKGQQLLPLFVYSMQRYLALAQRLPVSEGLRSFDRTSRTIPAALARFEDDAAAIDVRLMLQRKYFQNGERLQLRKMLDDKSIATMLGEHETLRLLDQLDELKWEEVELVLPTGERVNDLFKIAENVTYASLLHGDLERAKEAVEYPERMLLLVLAYYILKREALLLDFLKLCENTSVSALHLEDDACGAVLRWKRADGSAMKITGSPYWRGLVGKDASEGDLEDIAQSNSLDDNLVICIACAFLERLREEPFDIHSARQLVWRCYWRDWGDFSEARSAYLAIENPGFASRVHHEGGPQYAQIHIFARTPEPFIVDEPQCIQSACILTLRKRFRKWKVAGWHALTDRHHLCGTKVHGTFVPQRDQLS